MMLERTIEYAQLDRVDISLLQVSRHTAIMKTREQVHASRWSDGDASWQALAEVDGSKEGRMCDCGMSIRHTSFHSHHSGGEMAAPERRCCFSGRLAKLSSPGYLGTESGRPQIMSIP